jgi:hypothetical protein
MADLLSHALPTGAVAPIVGKAAKMALLPRIPYTGEVRRISLLETVWKIPGGVSIAWFW